MNSLSGKIELTDHFLKAYRKRVGPADPKEILERLQSSRPATTQELTLIIAKRPSQRFVYQAHRGVLHLVDDFNHVFVLYKELNCLVAITCYHAPYLYSVQKEVFVDHLEPERQEIEQIFLKTNEIPCSRDNKWALALTLLDEAGFSVFLEEYLQESSYCIGALGRVPFLRKTNGNRNFRVPSYLNFKKYCWKKEMSWSFADFNIHTPEDFLCTVNSAEESNPSPSIT